MIRSFRYRIYPNKEQEKIIKKYFGYHRVIYNHFIERLKGGAKGEVFTKQYFYNEITSLLFEREWLSEVHKGVFDWIYVNLSGLLESVKRGRIGFLRKKKSTQFFALRLNDGEVSFEGNWLNIPIVGRVKCRNSRELNGKIVSFMLKRNDLGEYYIVFTVKCKQRGYVEPVNKVIGVDLGVSEFAVLSTGEVIKQPEKIKFYLNKLTYLKNYLLTKQVGSRRWNKVMYRINIIKKRLVSISNDFLHKLTTRLIRENQVICLENLKGVKWKIKKGDKTFLALRYLTLSKFFRMLSYKALEYNRKIIYIRKGFPSSQLCSVCGYRNKNVSMDNLRFWVCPNCGEEHDRNVNAAKNILNEGLKGLKLVY